LYIDCFKYVLNESLQILSNVLRPFYQLLNPGVCLSLNMISTELLHVLFI